MHGRLRSDTGSAYPDLGTTVAAALVSIALTSVNAQAINPVTEILAEDIPTGTLDLGFGWRWGDSPYDGIGDVGSIDNENESNYDLMPFYFYEGKYLFAHGSSAGLHLFDNDRFELDALIAYRFDLVHRSGIFGRVDIIGNVSGGSDVLTAHMECVR